MSPVIAGSRMPWAGVGMSLVAAVLLVLAGASPSRATPLDKGAAQCQRDGGVYVYVIYQGAVAAQGCSSAGQSGAGHLRDITSLTWDPSSAGAVCRIAGLPQTCTPFSERPTTYWAYFWWRNGAWTYASQGASYRGPAGSVEAWNFSAGAAPSLTPPAPAGPR